MAGSEGSSNEDIGRPGPWKEGRYQRRGQSVDQTVQTPPGTPPSVDNPVSTTVTRKDYKFPDEESSEDPLEPPGGDAG
jgi:hypothetical protein